MNNFFAHQEQARSQSFRLLILFALAIVGVAVAVYLVAALAYVWSVNRSTAPAVFWHPNLFLWTTGGTLLFICIGSSWKIRELREGGGAIARTLGGRQVPPQPQDPRERQLRNVVEEMSIASGVPVPEIYLLDRERGINAFAAGHGLDDAVICVTRGAVELLDRDELQGVVAHEFSHILNGDMALNLSLLGWLNGILLLSQAGGTVLRGMRRVRGKGAVIIFLVALALYVVGYIGYFFGRLIKCAVARQREYLGDASAVQFTRNPEGLAGALKKVGGLSSGSLLDHPRAEELSHLFFCNGLRDAWLHALDTHPPLAERIRRLDPRFNGLFPEVTPLPAPPPADVYLAAQPARVNPEQTASLSGAAAMALLDQVGEPVQEHIERARLLIAGLPGSLLSETRYPLGACALVCGLLLDRDQTVRTRQMEIIDRLWTPAVAAEVRGLSPTVDALAPEGFLPLLDLSLPALRTMSREQFLLLKETVTRLSAADNRTSLFEFTLRYLLMRHLEPHFNPCPRRAPQIYAVRGVQQQCSCVLTALARVGQRDETLAQQAFSRGAKVLAEPRTEIFFLPAAECGAAALDEALRVLDGASLPIKRRLLAACLECLIHDGTVTGAEIELFRATADAVGCPAPPWLDSGNIRNNGSGANA
jgi:Zn-dependent protease with chaperone function